ncbi:MAG TPA: nucleotide pyrophosphohydrolase [Candidatus Sulfomarinibacteraceae bacterium]|nr:nucleotide pyrophosphohydrolase [Candidatus Sulfomarinibacteraceae bacterium]
MNSIMPGATARSPLVSFSNVLPMELHELEERMHAFVQSKGWYAEDSPKPQTPHNVAISLALEASEVLEHFQWQTEVRDKEALAGELADVALYLLQLASITDIDLERAILEKLAENQEREWPEP